MSTYEFETQFGAGEVQEAEFGEMQEAEFGEVLESQQPEMQGVVGEAESPLNEAQEMALAAEVLEISNEEELEQFLGNLIRGVSRGVGGFLRSGVGRSIGGILKNVARTALPMVGGAIGSFVAPGVGTAIGSRLGSMASQLFEVQLEGPDREDREFEVARRFVRLAATSARNAALAPRTANPQAVARTAVLTAARRHAPGVARRFRMFVRPAPWYWPQPVPGAYQDGYAAAQEPSYEPQPYEPQPAPEGQEWEEPWRGAMASAPAGGAMAGAPIGQARGAGSGNGRPQSGRWVRRGRRLIVLGI
jgi:uncharacterized protein (DUF697 family)